MKVDRLSDFRVALGTEDVSGMVEALKEIAIDPSAPSEIGLTLSFDLADRLRWRIVIDVRDTGAATLAGLMFDLLYRWWPDQGIFLVEALVIQVSVSPDVDRFAEKVASLTDRQDVPSSAALLIAYQAARNRDHALALHFMQHVDTTAEAAGPFAAYYVEALCNLGDAGHDFAIDNPLVSFLELRAREGTLPLAIRELVFFNRFLLSNPVREASTAIMIASRSFDVAGLSSAAAFFVATNQNDLASEIFRKAEARQDAWAEPNFAKWECFRAMKAGDAMGEKTALDSYVNAAPQSASFAPFSVAAAQDLELRERKLALDDIADRSKVSKADRKQRVFIGIFGQLREYAHTLPLLVEYFKHDMGVGSGDCELEFGLATWDNIGARRLLDMDGLHYYLEVAPAELAPIMAKAQVVNGFDLQRIMPNIAARMLEISANAAGKKATATEIATLLPVGSQIAIHSDASFKGALDARLSKAMPERAAAHLEGNMNQLRMWSRIAAVGDLARQREIAKGARFDKIVLIRSDLIVRSGSLSAQIGLPGQPADIVVSDYDGHAEYIEGIGDRYFIGSSHAIQPLFDCHDKLLEAFVDGSPFCIRSNPHEGASAVLFANGRYALTSRNIYFELHRGRMNLADMKDAIVTDAGTSPDAAIRAELQALIGSLVI